MAASRNCQFSCFNAEVAAGQSFAGRCTDTHLAWRDMLQKIGEIAGRSLSKYDSGRTKFPPKQMRHCRPFRTVEGACITENSR